MNSNNEARKSINSEDSWQWHLTFTGREMQHNYYLYHVIDGIMADNPEIAGIIEVGTGFGALTTHLGLWGVKKDIPVLTIDHKEMHDTKIFERLGITYLQMDEFDKKFMREVRLFLSKAKGPIFFICDGGSKVKEFNTFAPILPAHSIIAAHDWTIEINYSDIEKTVNNHCIKYNEGRWNIMNVQFATFKIKRPFLSIVTRNHPNREPLLERCKESLKSLDPEAFQHVIIHDTKGEGIPSANKLFYENKHLVTGKYVFILDDDDFLVSSDLISDLRAIARNNDNPEIIFVKMEIMGRIYPDEEVWGKNELIPGSLGSSCFIMLNSIWQESVEGFRTSDSPGDFNFINSALSKSSKIYWQSKVYSRAPRLHRGGNRGS